MKTISLFLLIAVFLTACKKNSTSGAKQTVLSKVIKNGKLTEEFLHSFQKRMVRINSYDELTGQFDYAYTFEYDLAGKMVLESQYSQTNKLIAQVIYTWGPGDKLDQHEYKSLSGADSGHITTRVKYSYDAAGRISKQSWVDLVTGDVFTSRDLSYYDNGNLRSSSVYYYYNAVPTLQWTTEYGPGDPLPGSILKSRGYPINFALYDLVAGDKHFYLYQNGAVSGETNQIFTNRQYDENGYLLQQTIKQKNILPAAPDKLIQMKYEYVVL